MAGYRGIVVVKERDCKEKARVQFSVADFLFSVETLPVIVNYFKISWKIFEVF